jgi:hypothetical protein
MYLFYMWFYLGPGRQKKGELTFIPHPDPGKAGIGPGHSLGPDIELRLRPVKDAGVQRVDSPDDLVQNENMNHE